MMSAFVVDASVAVKYQKMDGSEQLRLHLYNGFLRDAPILIDTARNHQRALALAFENRRSVYECEYLALALDEGCDLITADERFYNALHTKFSCMKLLHE